MVYRHLHLENKKRNSLKWSSNLRKLRLLRGVECKMRRQPENQRLKQLEKYLVKIRIERRKKIN
nr:hypothetical protein Iba_scaffold9175CG0270 [Ipomoea batatas]